MLIDMLQSFLDPHPKPEVEDDKKGILDVRVRMKSGKVINIELCAMPKYSKKL